MTTKQASSWIGVLFNKRDEARAQRKAIAA
jgi:hypothetical protein